MQDFSETDILNYLMVSEFNEGLTPDEFKFLLYRFRYHYRLMSCKNENLKYEIDSLKSKLAENSNIYNLQSQNLINEKNKFEKSYNDLINKKLTWKERIKGKIILKDEVNRIQGN